MRWNLFKKNKKGYVPDKIRDIESQMLYLMSNPTLVKAAIIGGREQMSSEDLILFQRKRIKVLQKILKNKNKMETIKQFNHYLDPMCNNCKELFTIFKVSAVPCAVDFKGYSYAMSIKEAIEDGY